LQSIDRDCRYKTDICPISGEARGHENQGNEAEARLEDMKTKATRLEEMKTKATRLKQG